MWSSIQSMIYEHTLKHLIRLAIFLRGEMPTHTTLARVRISRLHRSKPYDASCLPPGTRECSYTQQHTICRARSTLRYNDNLFLSFEDSKTVQTAYDTKIWLDISLRPLRLNLNFTIKDNKKHCTNMFCIIVETFKEYKIW